MQEIKRIGIMGAMPQEIEGVVHLLSSTSTVDMGQRTYYRGSFRGIETVVVFSRWGKVAAASTAATLIHNFGISHLLFTGVSGAIHPALRIGDIVIAESLIQHDFDARPLMGRHEIPLLNRKHIDSDPTLLAISERAVNDLLGSRMLHSLIPQDDLDSFNIVQPRLHIGEVASGDQFFSSSQQKQELRSLLPDTLCVEMEGAAVAQVCYEHGIPFCVIRTVSDAADDNSAIDFQSFIQRIASRYSAGIIGNIFEHLTSDNRLRTTDDRGQL